MMMMMMMIAANSIWTSRPRYQWHLTRSILLGLILSMETSYRARNRFRSLQIRDTQILHQIITVK